MSQTRRYPMPGHERDESTPAPGDLELVRSFLSLHTHEPGTTDSLPPTREVLVYWLEAVGLLQTGESRSPAALDRGLRVIDALRTKVFEQMGEPRDQLAIEVLNREAARAGLRMCFGCEAGDRLHVEASGVTGAVGHLLGIAFLAELDGTFARLRECAGDDCRAIFYDRSKNRSARWCSMSTCGNRSKVRRFRERHAEEEPVRPSSSAGPR